MDISFSIADLRRELGLSLGEFGSRIGLASKGNVSLIERGGRCSVKVALAIEALSGGRIAAASLNTDVALIDGFRAGEIDPLVHAPSDSAGTGVASPRNGGDLTPQAVSA